jgi:hypothetical protein
MPTTTYPETRYAPIRPINLASKDECARLSASALRGFFRLVKRWSLRDADAKQLLGGVTNGPYYEMKRHPDDRVLDPDTLVRISYLLGIFKALSSLTASRSPMNGLAYPTQIASSAAVLLSVI